jgi:hypothetical protein
MRPPFTPIGEKARWYYIYDLYKDAPVGSIVTYQAMADKLSLDPDADRHTIQVAQRRAAEELLEVNLRSVESVPRSGYRITEDKHKLVLAERQQVRARKSIERGKAQVDYVDLASLDAPTKMIFEAMAWKFAEQQEAIRRLDVRQKRQQKQIEAVAASTEMTAEQMTDLQRRLARLEAERQPDA